MWLIVGLGNPGARYLLTRHNAGFMALDTFATGCGSPPAKTEAQAMTSRLRLDDRDVLLVKPQNFMNNSGESVQELVNFYKIDLDRVLVVHDDADQGFGAIKFQRNRGHGGHNGVRSVSEKLGTQDYTRLKLGVGRPEDPRHDTAAYLLQNFSETEQRQLGEFLNRASDAIDSFIFDGFELASSRHNVKAPAPGPHGSHHKE